MRRLALAPLALVAACNGGGGPTGFSTSITTAPVASTSTTSGASTSTSTSAAEDSTAANSESASGSSSTSSSGIPDFGVVPDGGDGPPLGCKGKIDFLFTIGSGPYMFDQQAALKASFPGFSAILESEFADFDYHIMSANTSGLWGYQGCKGCTNECPGYPLYPCDVTPEPCDPVRGAGVTYPIGTDASNKRCDLASGRRYITAGQPNLEEAFTCIASMGTQGGSAVAMTTMMALSDELTGPGGCNEGFIRDDALLVVVAIQDTYAHHTEGVAEDWRDALVDAKGGDPDAIVLLVISTDVDEPDGLCGYSPGLEHELRTWTELMQPNSVFGSACADNFSPFFAEAAAKIKAQCDVFVPQ